MEQSRGERDRVVVPERVTQRERYASDVAEVGRDAVLAELARVDARGEGAGELPELVA